MVNLRITICRECGHPIKWRPEENEVSRSFTEKYKRFLSDITTSQKRYENKNISLHSFKCTSCGEQNSYTVRKCELEKMCV